MAADAVLVIDAGTSAMRALLVASTGAVETIAIEHWRMFVPEDAAPFGREFDAGEIQAALSRLITAAAVFRDRIAGIAFTGQREGLAFIDHDGAAILVSPNVDARASAEGIAIDAACAAAVYATTGHLPSLMQAPAKLAWLWQHRPVDAARVASALPLADWLAMLLAGRCQMSRSLAAENGLLDISSGETPQVLLERNGLPIGLVPPMLTEGAVAGEVRDGAFRGLPVVLAGADTQCALAGMGAIAVGDAGVAAGWSAPVQLVTGAPTFDCGQRTWTSVHVTPQRWILESNAGETGRAWDWLCTMMGLSAADADALAAAAPTGSGDAMAVLGPRKMDAARMTAGVGALTVPLPLVMSAPDRAGMLRSVLETAAYAIRANLEQLDEIGRKRAARLRLGGGMSRSRAFAQIVTDVIDRPVLVASTPETSALGAAALAAPALGLHPSIEDAVRTMTSAMTTIEPNVRRSADYEDHYARWCALSDEMARLA